MRVRDKIIIVNALGNCRGCGQPLPTCGPIYVEERDYFGVHARCLTSVPNTRSYTYLPLDVILEISGVYEKILENKQ